MAALSNPAINPPILSSARRSLHSPSPSRSPIRNARDFDPLLRDLSPTTTLRAFTTEAASRHDSGHGTVASSFDTASPSERALGARAAQTCIDLRSWTRELESWEWPGTFDIPEPARKRVRMSGLSTFSVLTARTSHDGDDGENEFWGSLPGQTVLAYEKRVDEIGQALETLDVEELKDYVLSAHKRAGDRKTSMNDSSSAIGAHTDLRQLDDFTALITATILQALPYLSRLNRLLDVWHIRLYILRETPTYLEDLKQARTDLDHGWAAIAVAPASGGNSKSATFTRENMADMQSVIQEQVTSLGRRLDSFLDVLEGREETVPDAWIEDFETLGSAYGDWVVQAERKVLEHDWRMAKEQDEKDVESQKAEQALTAGQSSPEQDRKVSQSYETENPSRDRDSMIIPSSRPTSGVFDFTIGQLQAGSLQSFQSPSEKPREDTDTIPLPDDDQRQLAGRSRESLAAPDRNAESPTKRFRHVPIIVDYDHPDQIQSIDADTAVEQQAQLDQRESSMDIRRPPPTDTATDSNNVKKKRAAFLNGDIERANSLQKATKTPVRPFEHASNAFTRLFRKDKTPEQSRSSSQRSNWSQRSSGSGKRASGKGEKSKDGGDGDAGIVWGGRKGMSPLGDEARTKPVSRSRSASHRSLSREAKRSAPRDYADMPGGFRTRSMSVESRQRAQSLTQSRAEYEGQERRLERLSKVETYQPKRLSSPFRPPSAKPNEPEYPADWPLASPPATEASSPVKELAPAGPSVATTSAMVEDPEPETAADSSPEMTSPRIAIETDMFDQIFVNSLPVTPEPEFEGNPMATVRVRSRSSSKRKSEVPTLHEAMLRSEASRHSLLVPDSRVEEARSGSISSGISPEDVQGAQRTEYFPPQSSSQASAGASDIAMQRRTKSKSPTSPVLRLKIPDSYPTDGGAELEDDGLAVARPDLIKRASVASIESHPRSSLRSIDLSLRGDGTARSAPQTPREPVSAIELTASARRTPNSPLSYNGLMVFPSPPGTASGTMPTSPVSPVSRDGTPLKSRFASLPFGTMDFEDVAESPVSARSEDEAPAPLNAAMAKRKGKGVSNGTAWTPTKRGDAASTLSKKRAEPLKPGEDTFDRHVSEVLNRLPSSAIKFRSRQGAETPSGRTAERRDYSGPRPKVANRAPSRTGTSGMTLAPADSSPKKSAEDVKLYHLTQAGREEPIKLFVRLVGEGERVMVRVGGGWADLADYLRQYAEHHGSRTVSGGGLEIQTADGNVTGSRKVSASATPGATEPKTKGTTITPASGMARPGSRMADAPAQPEWSGPLPSTFSMGDTDGEDSPIAPAIHNQTPTNTIATQRSTPKSTSTKADSRPSTAGSMGRPGSSQGWTASGLAGLSSGKRGDLGEQKARWVEGMIEKAKAASAEKSKEEKAKHFGEMGKAGGTRRVIFRQASGAGGKNGEESMKL